MAKAAAPALCGKEHTEKLMDYVIFDLETTGLSTKKCMIIEISALRVRNGRVTDTFSTLVNPNEPIHYMTVRLTGITDSMVKGAPGIETVLPDFLDFIGTDILIGHNSAAFDMRITDRFCREVCGHPLANDYADTLKLSRKRLPQLESHSLGALAAYFNVSYEGAHRALQDCYITQQVYSKLNNY
ncbi:MAG: PolC-type DNA polymerase III [Huintestinicola sp.]